MRKIQNFQDRDSESHDSYRNTVRERETLYLRFIIYSQKEIEPLLLTPRREMIVRHVDRRLFFLFPQIVAWQWPRNCRGLRNQRDRTSSDPERICESCIRIFSGELSTRVKIIELQEIAIQSTKRKN